MAENDQRQFYYTWDDKEEPRSRFLIIGNGFDIECGLPTSYGDFLDFAQFLESTHFEISQYAIHSGLSWPVDDTLSSSTFLEKHPNWFGNALEKLPAGIRPLIEPKMNMWSKHFESWITFFDNYWYRHFQKARSGIGKDWVDFEAEIARVIRTIEDSMVDSRAHQAYLDDNVGCPYPWELSDMLAILLKDVDFATREQPGGQDYRTYNMTYRQLRDKLLGDLNELTERLERYLSDYVENIDVEETETVSRVLDLLQEAAGEDTCAVTFNYTTTLERMLEDRNLNLNVCYVHGKLCNGGRIVLGMDEYLSEEDVRRRIEFSSFRKYNQRILKRTDSSYMQWTKRFKDYAQTKREVLVFGHSLGSTDSDLLRRFMDVGSARTTIYYHNEDAFSERLANMTAMMGMDYVIERTGLENNTLRFVDQHDLQNQMS